ncbi:MAG TPA: EVE domain-containing protein [Gemmatimonadaceae bacterium]|nr:EVE domain-containing protein [Gemmatimonadaceae bacterium]
MNPFVVGQEYIRREIHDQYGGGRQGGISPSRRYPLVLLFTGKTGEQYGYNDGWDADGVFWYTGEGRIGDMTLTRGNLAIAKAHAENRRLLLFEQRRRGRVTFLGEFRCIAQREVQNLDQLQQARRAIQFGLLETAEAAATAGTNYWLEITDRDDLGVNLKAPQASEDGKPYWSYSVIKEIQPGDIVFHYHKHAAGIVACSRAVGEVWEEAITWAAKGTSARKEKTEPHRRPGWCLGLEAFTPLEDSLRLDAIRERETEIRAIPASQYSPFSLSPNRPLRPQQAYLTRFPREFLALFPTLQLAASRMTASTARPTKIGRDYVWANEEVATSERDPFAVDPAIVERGNRAHRKTQNLLADYVKSLGGDPRLPLPEEPSFDVAWEGTETIYVAEVKSVTKRNEERQLRLGLGQVLRYQHVLAASGKSVRAVLAIERAPSDPSWSALCRELGVALVWVGNFDVLSV